MHIYDRLYGEMEFPDIIQNLLDCPALLRLRDVRMANNQFVAFPAFSNTSRYEHSLGVCYLAGICAEKLDLSEKDKIELMMACLYHDVGTPPFAHAMEEVLQAEYGFDHEENLRELIEGRNYSYVGNLDQIYMGSSIKLRSVCQSKTGQKLNLDVYRIAKLIVGDKSEPLSFLLNGGGIDLDNIDNVLRASSAMGIIGTDVCGLAKRLASSYMISDERTICIDALYLQDIKLWQQIRDNQYTAIFDSIEDFAYQTMIKKSLKVLINDKDSMYKLSKDSWKLTDASILHNFLLNNESSAPIMKRVLLNKPFKCLEILYVSGENVVNYINNHIEEIEKKASQYYIELMGIKINHDKSAKQNLLNPVIANFYPDKRKRPIQSKALLMGKIVRMDGIEQRAPQGALLGLFATISNQYKTVTDKKGKTVRKVVTFTSANTLDMMKYLHNTVLKQFEVSIYGKTNNKRNSDAASENQLGFC